MAQSSTDPSAGSPAGTVYELPVDKGRTDAAPGRKGDGGGGGDESGTADGGSLYRSENNFGTSARVPGAPPKLRPPADDDDIEQAAVSSEPASDQGGPSESGAVALLGLLAAGGIGIGFLSRRSWE
jgi:hypothetical protein